MNKIIDLKVFCIQEAVRRKSGKWGVGRNYEQSVAMASTFIWEIMMAVESKQYGPQSAKMNLRVNAGNRSKCIK